MSDSQDRRVIEITIKFNITAIGKWLKSGGKFEDIDKMAKEWATDSVEQEYVIDMFPIGQKSNAYFHRSKRLISQNISGLASDFNGIEEGHISTLEWNYWRGCLLLSVESTKFETDTDTPVSRAVFISPVLSEVLELETNGVLNKPGHLMDADQEIKVPSEYDSNDNPTGYSAVWRYSSSPRSVGYRNGLAGVFIQTGPWTVFY